ncbi:uncharacterized protein LOC114460571 isoform X2 [Gouania willdenowi]|uniref:uncharacterized protein LOC114460571 isoform X2 n=1 Tax=Gouania willdenowi TaxID=441366 RepID=UPI0010551B77|nr:uncharacterized protein LOC114460571 isoform X2 [Gouania willdenowi]
MFVWRFLLFLWWISQFLSSASDLKNISAELGENVILPCQARGKGTIRAVQWNRTDLKDGYVLLYKDKQLDPDFQHQSYKDRVGLNRTHSDISLILKNVTADDEGIYEGRILEKQRNKRYFENRVVPPKPGHDVNLSSKAPDGQLKDWKTTEQQDEHPDPDYQKNVTEEENGEHKSLKRQKRSNLFGSAVCTIRLIVVPPGSTTEDTGGHPGGTATKVSLGLVVVVVVVVIFIRRKKVKKSSLFREESENETYKDNPL